MKKIPIILSLLGLLIPANVLSQDIKLVRSAMDTLTSKTMWGRGYTKNGLNHAANYISTQFQAFGLVPMRGNTFKQTFPLPVNTFPGDMKLRINGKALIAGKEFIVRPESRGMKASGKLEQKDSVTFMSIENKIILTLKDKLTWSVSKEQADYMSIEVLRSAINIPETIDIDIETQFMPSFKAENIAGIVRGTKVPDSLLVFTAHYDHLGGMGRDTYFPGANDNASGVSLLLNMARHYTENPPPYTMAFICFAGEEAGLVGSKYFTEHPLIDLKKIRFLINVDMVGTGETGITVVNARVYPKEFAVMNEINSNRHYLPKISSRGKAANSDHYFFTEKGVPAFFIYTTGGIKAYHDVNDIPATLPFTEFNDLFKLLLDFNSRLTE